MIVAQETTNWKDSTPNHIYFLNDSKTKMYAYIQEGSDEHKVFKNPIDFFAKGRTFEVLRKVDEQRPGIAVKGSKGDVYYVTNENNEYKCTCVGFKYHGTCKHIDQVRKDT
jgi:uncharacterized Zn finger protein